MPQAIGYAASSSRAALKPLEFERDAAKADEVEIEVLFCGVCHSDIHQVENDWDNTVYPCMPGHEIVGRVTSVGASVTRYAIGDLVGVGCIIDSCRKCASCHEGLEQFCEGPNAFLATYNGPMKPAAMANGQNIYGRDNTYGGYSSSLTVKEDFVLRIPSVISPQEAAPLLCAGITTYSPLRHWKVKAGDKIGVVGFGGLGHVAIQMAKAMGADVTVFTSSKDKLDAAEKFGAEVVLVTDEDAMEALNGTIDFIIDTIPEGHKIDPFIKTLKRDGALCVLGALDVIPGYDNQEMIMGRKTIAASVIGGIAETQEMLDFAAEHGVRPDVEIISIDQINEAFDAVKKGEVRFRHVIDMSTLNAPAA